MTSHDYQRAIDYFTKAIANARSGMQVGLRARVPLSDNARPFSSVQYRYMSESRGPGGQGPSSSHSVPHAWTLVLSSPFTFFFSNTDAFQPNHSLSVSLNPAAHAAAGAVQPAGAAAAVAAGHHRHQQVPGAIQGRTACHGEPAARRGGVSQGKEREGQQLASNCVTAQYCMHGAAPAYASANQPH